jgi:hypothetical protein
MKMVVRRYSYFQSKREMKDSRKTGGLFVIKHPDSINSFAILLVLFATSLRGDTPCTAPLCTATDTSFTALFVPLDSITLSLLPEKKLATLKKNNPIYLFFKKDKKGTYKPIINKDSSYCAMANELALNEASQRFKTVRHEIDDHDSVQDNPVSFLSHTHWSCLANDTAFFERVSAVVKEVAQKDSVDLIIIPYACSIHEYEMQTKGWRNDKYGEYYKKPAAVYAKAQYHVQVWDKNGALLGERNGTGLVKRPLFYDALKQDWHANRSLVEFSKNIFAPAPVRALGDACRNAFAGPKKESQTPPLPRDDKLHRTVASEKK